MLDLNLKLLSSIIANKSKNKSTIEFTNTQELENTSIELALVQLETEVSKMEKYGTELVEKKRQLEQEKLQTEIEQGVQELEIIAGRINTLAAQLEAEMHKFKDIAIEVNRSYHLMQKFQDSEQQSSVKKIRPSNIWEMHFSSIPVIIKRGTKFIVTEKIVNLFKDSKKSFVRSQRL